MRVGVCGVGLRSAAVLGCLKHAMPEIEFVGYYDPSPTLLDQLCDPNEITRYNSTQDMIDAANLDLLFVGSPNHIHLEQIELGLKAGIRIFTEKPVVTDLEQTWALAELLRKYGSDQVMVGLVLRYAPQIVDLRKALNDGALGKVVSLEANEHIEPAHGAFFMRDWRRYDRYSGGFMLEKCVHDLDLYNMIANSRPKKVASFGGRSSFLPENAPTINSDAKVYHQKRSIWESTDDAFQSDGDIVDFQTAIISYENGVSLAFHTNTNIPDEQRRFMIAGTKGMAEGDFQRGYLNVTSSPSGSRVFEKDYTQTSASLGEHYGADAQMGRDIADYVKGNRKSLPVSIVDALEAGIAAMALDQARISGEMVDLTEMWERFDSYELRK
jgi:predicted dehydrogenase